MNIEPIFMALNDATVRVDPREIRSVKGFNTGQMHVRLQLIFPAEHSQDGAVVRPDRIEYVWLREDQAKQLTDILMAPFAMKYVDPAMTNQP